MEQNNRLRNKKKLGILLVFGVVILILAGGFFYYKHKVNGNVVEKTEPPRLFSKGDYVVEERQDGKYIVVDKVGLTAKVPDGWRVEFEGEDKPDGTSQYWVNLMSQDAEKENGILVKGCGISALVGLDSRNNEDIKNQIIAIREGSKYNLRENYNYEISKIGNYEGVKWTGVKRKFFGQNTGIDLALKDKYVVSFSSVFPETNEDGCKQLWSSFMETIIIK